MSLLPPSPAAARVYVKAVNMFGKKAVCHLRQAFLDIYVRLPTYLDKPALKENENYKKSRKLKKERWP